MINTKEKESVKLRLIKKQLEAIGFYVILSRASLGPFDLVAMDRGGGKLIQIKVNSYLDAAERETIVNFDKCPLNFSKEVWCYQDKVKQPVIRVY